MEFKKIEIRHVMEHYEAYINGQFVVSGDTIMEVIKELEEIGIEL